MTEASLPELKCPARLIYLGTLKLDVISRLGHARFDAPGDIYELSDIKVKLGGTAANFARAARGLFTKTTVIAANGDDQVAEILESQLTAVCDEVLLQRCDGMASAVVMNVRDAPDREGVSRRLLLSSRVSPHMMLTPAHVRACAKEISESDVLIADGYCLQHDTSRAALGTAFEIAEHSDVGTIFDLVPHSLPAVMPAKTVTPVLRAVDIVIAEARTVVGLSEQRWPLSVTSEDELIARAREAVDRLAGRTTWILRYGFENMEDTLVLRGGQTLTSYQTAYRQADEKAAFGDVQLVRELRTMLLDEGGKMRGFD